MKLTIITTQKSTEYHAQWVEINTPVGNMVIQQHHAPLIIELAAGQECTLQTTENDIQSIMVVQGVAHITREEVKILLPMDL